MDREEWNNGIIIIIISGGRWQWCSWTGSLLAQLYIYLFILSTTGRLPLRFDQFGTMTTAMSGPRLPWTAGWLMKPTKGCIHPNQNFYLKIQPIVCTLSSTHPKLRRRRQRLLVFYSCSAPERSTGGLLIYNAFVVVGVGLCSSGLPSSAITVCGEG